MLKHVFYSRSSANKTDLKHYYGHDCVVYMMYMYVRLAGTLQEKKNIYYKQKRNATRLYGYTVQYISYHTRN